MILQNLTTTNHRQSGESKYDRKLTELDVVTTRVWYRVNGVSDPVYTVPDPHGHDIKLNTFKTRVALKLMILQNLTTTNRRKSDESKYDRKLTKLDVVTTRIRYRVNGV